MSEIKITFYGQALFLIESGKGIRIGTDPYDETVRTPLPVISADIATSSHSHFDHAHFSLFKNNPVIVNTPGKTNVLDISFEGIPSFHDEENGARLGVNTIFKFEIDGISIAHLGDLGHMLSDNQITALGEIDILLAPVGGIYTIDADTAIKIAQKLKPGIFIPMHYSEKDLKVNLDCANIEDFKKKADNYKQKGHQITVSKSDIPEKTEIWIMESS